MKKLLLILLCLPFIGFGQNVYIPDANFKAYLLGNSAINTNGDSEIQLSEANSYTGPIYCSGLSINNLTGIEYFTKISTIGCNNNQITSLDLSNNNCLTSIQVHDNMLNYLNLANGNHQGFGCNPPNQGMDIFVFLTYNNPNLSCIIVDDSIYSTINWVGYLFEKDSQHYYSENCTGTTSVQEHTTNKEIFKVTDLLGKETKEKKYEPLIYIYDDGTVEKKIIID